MDPKRMKATELREALKKRGLSPAGVKADLVNRLQARLDEEEFDLEGPPPASSSSAVEGGGESQKIVEAKKSKSPPSSGKSKSPPVSGATDDSSKERKSPLKKRNLLVEQTPAGDSKTDTSEKKIEPTDEANGSIPGDESGNKKPRDTMTFEEKKQERAKRFNLPDSFEDKKRQRAERFGIPLVADPGADGSKKARISETTIGIHVTKEGEKLTLKEIEKRLARAKRFNSTDDKTEELKSFLRKERFQQ